jgi:hypothetical protein
MTKTLPVSTAVSGLTMSGVLAQSTQGLGGDTREVFSMRTADQWVFSKSKGTDVVGPKK